MKILFFYRCVANCKCAFCQVLGNAASSNHIRSRVETYHHHVPEQGQVCLFPRANRSRDIFEDNVTMKEEENWSNVGQAVVAAENANRLTTRTMKIPTRSATVEHESQTRREHRLTSRGYHRTRRRDGASPCDLVFSTRQPKSARFDKACAFGVHGFNRFDGMSGVPGADMLNLFGDSGDEEAGKRDTRGALFLCVLLV